MAFKFADAASFQLLVTSHASSSSEERFAASSEQLPRGNSGPAIFMATSTATGVNAMDKMTTQTKTSSNFCGKRLPAPVEVA